PNARGARQEPAIGGERQAQFCRLVEAEEFSAGLRVPDLQAAGPGCHKAFAVGTEGSVSGSRQAALEGKDFLSCPQIPHLPCVSGKTGKASAVWGERHWSPGTLVISQARWIGIPPEVPHKDDPGLAASKVFAIGTEDFRGVAWELPQLARSQIQYV